MSQTPTNTDLSAALREIADTLPLGSQLIVRLAADRLGDGCPEVLGEHDPDRDTWVGPDEWIKWNPDSPEAISGPRLDASVLVDARFADGSQVDSTSVGYWVGPYLNNWTRREPHATIVAYRIVPT